VASTCHGSAVGRECGREAQRMRRRAGEWPPRPAIARPIGERVPATDGTAQLDVPPRTPPVEADADHLTIMHRYP